MLDRAGLGRGMKASPREVMAQGQSCFPESPAGQRPGWSSHACPPLLGGPWLGVGNSPGCPLTCKAQELEDLVAACVHCEQILYQS